MKVFLLIVSFLSVSSGFLEKRNLNRSRTENESSLNEQSSSVNNEFEGEFNNLRRHLPSLEDYSSVIKTSKLTENCRKDFIEYLRSLANFEMWALEMHDASSKSSSGLLSGNINSFGDFDECLHAKSSSSGFNSQYCLAYVKIDVPNEMKKLNSLKRRSHSLETFRSNFTRAFDDLYHYIPIFSSFLWSSCIPSSCSHVDFQQIVQSQFMNFFNGNEIEISTKTNEKLCQTNSQDVTLSVKSKVVIFFLATLFVVILLSTLYESLNAKDDKVGALTSFSLIRNWKELISMEDTGSDDIKSLHGIRFFAVVMIFISHKSFFAYFYPMANRTRIIEETFKGSTVPIRAGYLYTELFLTISGLLASYSLLRRLERNKTINVFKEYFDRYLRIMPSLAVLVFISAFILPHLGSGPLYKFLTEREAELCSKYWWRNLLLINVWFGVRPMCGFHTQHVAIDFELFLLAPLIVLLIYKWPKAGLKLTLLTAIVSSLAKSYVAYEMNLSEFVVHGMTSEQLIQTGDYMYIVPPFRFTSYAIGILAGYYLRRLKHHNLSSKYLYFAWTSVLTLLSIGFRLSAELCEESYVYNRFHAAMMTFLPIPFCAMFALIVFTADANPSNFFTSILQWRGFKITTRLSYNFYLIQFIVFYYNTGTARGAIFYNLIRTGFDLNELFFILLGTLLLTLSVEMPVKNLRNSIFKQRQVCEKESKNKKQK